MWLLDLWEALTGSRPPDDARVIVAGEAHGWQQAPVGPRAQLWQAVRLITLHAIWEARCSLDPAKRTPRSAASAAVRALRAEVQVQHDRCCRRDEVEAALPTAFLSTRRLQPAAGDFAAVWVVAGLCRLEVVVAGSDDDNAAAAGPLRRLVVELSEAAPVPIPAAAQAAAHAAA
jgi:hypothetical protein